MDMKLSQIKQDLQVEINSKLALIEDTVVRQFQISDRRDIDTDEIAKCVRKIAKLYAEGIVNNRAWVDDSKQYNIEVYRG